MAKESYYFSHDYNLRNDDKILELRAEFGAEGYGIFWMIIETMAENENGGVKATLMGGLSVSYGVAIGRLSEIITKCINTGLLYEKDGILFSKRLLGHKYIRKNMSEYGKKGASLRWGGDSHPIATPSPPYSPPNGQTMLKERKGKEIKENTIDDNTHKHQEVTKPMTTDDFINFQSKLIQEQIFTELIMNTRGIKTKVELLNWIKCFNVHISGEGKLNKDYGEYKRHFKNWITIQDTTKPAPVINSSSQIKIKDAHQIIKERGY